MAYRELPASSPAQPTRHLFQRRLADKLHTVEAVVSLEVKAGLGAAGQVTWTREALQTSQLRPQQVRQFMTTFLPFKKNTVPTVGTLSIYKGCGAATGVGGSDSGGLSAKGRLRLQT